MRCTATIACSSSFRETAHGGRETSSSSAGATPSPRGSSSTGSPSSDWPPRSSRPVVASAISATCSRRSRSSSSVKGCRWSNSRSPRSRDLRAMPEPPTLRSNKLVAGARSAPEGDFRLLAVASAVLPPLLYNPLLQLPSGRLISPDALALESGVVHETNGRRHHAREDFFESMQERHDAMTAAGLIVLHNSPRRLALQPRLVIAEFEACHLRNAGRGLPPGVQLLRSAA